MLHHHEGIAPRAQFFQGVEQVLVVSGMEPDGGLIEHIQDAAEIRPQLSRQPDPLTFATAQGDHTAAELQIT